MINMNKPEDDVAEILLDCISNYRDKDLKRRFQLSKDYISNCTNDYNLKAQVHETYKYESHDIVSNVTKKDMVSLYNDKFVKSGQPGRVYYDKILHSAPHGVCPFCGIRIASTLDHYLNKANFPVYSISPINLIPACKDCNKDKGEQVSEKAEHEFIHPYYDIINNHIWLKATLQPNENTLVTYSVKKPDEWSNLLYLRVVNYFKTLKLNSLYGIHAVGEILNNKYKLSRLKQKAGIDELINDLNETALSCEYYYLNSWQSALYRELSSNEWFYSQYI